MYSRLYPKKKQTKKQTNKQKKNHHLEGAQQRKKGFSETEEKNVQKSVVAIIFAQARTSVKQMHFVEVGDHIRRDATKHKYLIAPSSGRVTSKKKPH